MCCGGTFNFIFDFAEDLFNLGNATTQDSCGPQEESESWLLTQKLFDLYPPFGTN